MKLEMLFILVDKKDEKLYVKEIIKKIFTIVIKYDTIKKLL